MGNPNNLSARLTSEIPTESQIIFNEIKKSVKAAKNLQAK
jgi:hypothetical protein